MDNKTVVDILGLLLAGGLLTLVGNIYTTWSGRGKQKAEAEKILLEAQGIAASTTKIHTQTIAELSLQLNQLQRAHDELHAELEADREESEKIREIDRSKNLRLRDELDRLHRELELLRQELQTERQRNLHLTQTLNMELEKSSQKTSQIVQLRQQVDSLATKQKTITGEMKEVLRKTGKLEFPPPRPDE